MSSIANDVRRNGYTSVLISGSGPLSSFETLSRPFVIITEKGVCGGPGVGGCRGYRARLSGCCS